MTLLRIAPVFALALAAAPRPADACSAPQCWPGYFTPGDQATVPANLPAIYWRPIRVNAQGETPDVSRVQLTTVADPATPLAFTATAQPNGDYLIVPTAPLVAGTDYQIVDHSPCGETENAGPHAMFHAGPSAPLPATLGSLSIYEHGMDSFEVGTARGSCSSTVLADQARLELTASADAGPWRDALHFQTIVDDQVWSADTSINSTSPPGASWVGRAQDRVYHVCSTDDDSIGDGLATGSHHVTMTATLPGTTVSLTAAAVTLDLECAGTGSGSGSDIVMPIEDGCNAGGAAGPLVLLALFGLARKRR